MFGRRAPVNRPTCQARTRSGKLRSPKLEALSASSSARAPFKLSTPSHYTKHQLNHHVTRVINPTDYNGKLQHRHDITLNNTTNPQAQADPSQTAFLLALLTAGGGLTGYIRTGSVPSVAAGMTVGALVYPPFLPNLPQPLPSLSPTTLLNSSLPFPVPISYPISVSIPTPTS